MHRQRSGESRPRRAGSDDHQSTSRAGTARAGCNTARMAGMHGSCRHGPGAGGCQVHAIQWTPCGSLPASCTSVADCAQSS